MAVKTWTIVDQAHQLRLEELTVTAGDVGGKAEAQNQSQSQSQSQSQKYSVAVRTCRGGLSEGVTCIHVDTGDFSFDVLPTRGMGIWKAWLGGEEIGWQSPVRGPVHPAFVPISETSGLGWLDGFDELLVRCGLESNGAPEFDDQGRLKYPLHGRIANRPAHLVQVEVDGDTGQITIVGEVEETRFHFLKLRMRTTIVARAGVRGFRVLDEVRNLSGSPAECQLLYHVNFGRPLLDAGARLIAPVKTVVPRNARAAEGIGSWDHYAAEQAGYTEQVYFLELLGDAQRQTQVLLKNAHGTRGVGMKFNLQQLPWFTLWKNTIAGPDGYVTGLEPGTNFPNPRSFEGKQRRIASLPPGGTTVFDLQLTPLGSPADVEAVEKAVMGIQGRTAPTIHKEPQPGWCTTI